MSYLMQSIKMLPTTKLTTVVRKYTKRLNEPYDKQTLVKRNMHKQHTK